MAMRLFVLYAVIELAVIVALTSTIGFGWTVLALLGDLRAGPRAGRIAGQAPHSPAPVRPDRATVQGAATDSVLVALGTVLVVIPGLASSGLGAAVAAAADPRCRPPAGHRDRRATDAAGHRGRRYGDGYRLAI